MRRSISKILFTADPGLLPYGEAWDLQHRLHSLRREGKIEDTLLLLEHPHTYTLGKTANRANLTGSDRYLEENGIKVFEIDRGGDITYHGPGQLVGYPIIDLQKWKPDSHLYLRTLEEMMIDVLADYGIAAGRKDGFTGVWVYEEKIAAIGIKISRWVTMHGFAFNINTDLNLFSGIIPCGIKDKDVTSLSKILGREIDMNEIKRKIINRFAFHFGHDDILEKSLHQLTNFEN